MGGRDAGGERRKRDHGCADVLGRHSGADTQRDDDRARLVRMQSIPRGSSRRSTTAARSMSQALLYCVTTTFTVVADSQEEADEMSIMREAALREVLDNVVVAPDGRP